MSKPQFEATPQQERVLKHAGSAFVQACPGAGKTRVIVERAREILRSGTERRGIGFLSFTRGAISHLENELCRQGLVRTPVFPHFIGTFDSFVWQFFVQPFVVPESGVPPHLIPDKQDVEVRPFNKAQPLPLSCFDRKTGKIIEGQARRRGFDTRTRTASSTKAYETRAARITARFQQQGYLDFDDARDVALARLSDQEFSARLASALAGRFSEIIVDEAQDCNPADLQIIAWLREGGLPTKVVCDPFQSIYEFRGGVTDQLLEFSETFDQTDRLRMSGNFRSSENICRAIATLRPLEHRTEANAALGPFRSEPTVVHILSYSGNSVPGTIAVRFGEVLAGLEIDPADAPVVAATKDSGSNAIGQPTARARRDLTLRLAEAVNDFYFAFDSRKQASAIEHLHRVMIELQGKLSHMSYNQYIVSEDLKPNKWRPEVLYILRQLRYDPLSFPDPVSWHLRAKDLLKSYIPTDGPSISQRLKANSGLDSILLQAPRSSSPAKTIHSVKGMEFPAVCVVTVPQTLKGILDFLETGLPQGNAEMARELYVAASRAQRLLAIAVPRSQAERFSAHLRLLGAAVDI